MCIDFRALNSKTIPDPYQMSLIDDILDNLASAQFISKIDLEIKAFTKFPSLPMTRTKQLFVHPGASSPFLGCLLTLGMGQQFSRYVWTSYYTVRRTFYKLI